MKILEIITPLYSDAAWQPPDGLGSIQDAHLFRLGVYDQEVDVSAAVTREPFDEVEIDFDDVLGVATIFDLLRTARRWKFAQEARVPTHTAPPSPHYLPCFRRARDGENYFSDKVLPNRSRKPVSDW